MNPLRGRSAALTALGRMLTHKGRWHKQPETNVNLRPPRAALVDVAHAGVGDWRQHCDRQVVNAVLLEPLPFAEPDRLVGLWQTAPGVNITDLSRRDGAASATRRRFSSSRRHAKSAVNAETTSRFRPLLVISTPSRSSRPSTTHERRGSLQSIVRTFRSPSTGTQFLSSTCSADQ